MEFKERMMILENVINLKYAFDCCYNLINNCFKISSGKEHIKKICTLVIDYNSTYNV